MKFQCQDDIYEYFEKTMDTIGKSSVITHDKDLQKVHFRFTIISVIIREFDVLIIERTTVSNLFHWLFNYYIQTEFISFIPISRNKV